MSYLFVSGRSSAGRASSCWRETRLMQYTVSGRRDRISGPALTLHPLWEGGGDHTDWAKFNPKRGGRRGRGGGERMRKINNKRGEGKKEKCSQKLDVGFRYPSLAVEIVDETFGESRSRLINDQ